MTIVQRPRVDRIQIRLDKDRSKRKFDLRGYLLVWGTVVSAGQNLEYMESDGAPRDGWIEHVPESTVFNQGALDTLKNAPITLNHPPEMLDTSNTSRYQVGSVIELKRDGDKLRALHQITDARALDAIDSGVFELSPGYIADIDETAGEVNGVRHDAVQVGRVYNHHSIVPEARAGHSNKLDSLRRAFRMDGLSISRQQQQRRRDNTMGDEADTEKRDYELGEETFTLPVAIVDRLESLEKKVAGKAEDAEHDEEKEGEGSSEGDDDDDDDKEESEDSDKRDKDEGKRGDALTRGDIGSIAKLVTTAVLKTQLKQTAKADAVAKRRAAVITEARAFLPQSYNFDGQSAAKIMFDAVVAVNPDSKGKAEKYRNDAGVLRGMFVMLRDPKRGDGAPIGGTGENVSAQKRRWTMDASVIRRDERVAKTTRSFRRLRMIGQQLSQDVSDRFGDDLEKAG